MGELCETWFGFSGSLGILVGAVVLQVAIHLTMSWRSELEHASESTQCMGFKPSSQFP